MTLGYHLMVRLSAVSKKKCQEVGGVIPVSLAPGIVIRAPDKTRARESGDEANRHSLPDIDDFPLQLAGEVALSKLDLSRAYHQLRLEEQSQELTTIITHKNYFVSNGYRLAPWHQPYFKESWKTCERHVRRRVIP